MGQYLKGIKISGLVRFAKYISFIILLENDILSIGLAVLISDTLSKFGVAGVFATPVTL